MKLNVVVSLAMGMLVCWSIVGIVMHSYRLASVSVQLSDNGIEHRDKKLLMVGAEDEAPDYRLRVREKNHWWDLGTYGNTWIGDGLEFTVSQDVRFDAISEVQLLDQDKVESDVLEQFPLKDSVYHGRNYTLVFKKEWSLGSGWNWFFDTPVGLAILGGITLGVAVLILGSVYS